MNDHPKPPLGNSPLLDKTFESAVNDSDFVRSLLALSDDCVKVLDLNGRLQLMSPGGLRVMEIDDFTPFESCLWLDLWNGPHADDAKAALDAARQGKIGRFSGHANTAKGNRRFWDVQVAPIFDGNGNIKALLSVSRDTTEKLEILARQEESLQEMRHRAKNALTIVQAIASQTLKAGGEQLNPIGRTFTQRLQALARSYDALVLHDWASASLRDLIVNTLIPFDEEQSRITHGGPEVVLDAPDAMALGLAINELATNAAKYGALSNSTGRVTVQWQVEGEPARLHLRWSEEGGPIVEKPTRRGFGSALIDRALPGELGGTVKISYHPEGVVCDIDVALKSHTSAPK